MKNFSMYRLALLCLLSVPVYFSCNDKPRGPVVVNKTTEKNGSTGTSPILVNAKPPASPFDQSPLDIVYFPVDYPKLKSQRSAPQLPKIRVLYSRPQRHGRVIFGQLEKYGHPWRMGANEATEIELFENASINGKKLAKGRYIMYCIPKEESWTIVFNSNLYTWGLEFDTTKDVLHVSVPVQKLNSPSEVLTMQFSDDNGSALLAIEWDMVRTVIPFRFN